MADYYSEDEQAESMPDNEEQEPKEDSGAETSLLSKSAFGGHEIKVGDVCEFRIVAIHDDQAEVEYVEEGKDEDMDEPRSTGNSMERMQAYADKP